jgi:methylmalonyl-CoA mutase cobalamin-binding domain/chain
MDAVEVNRLAPADLPDWHELVHKASEIASDIRIPSTLFREHYGVRTEEEFRLRMAREDQVIAHINIGLRTWKDTAEALKYINAEAARRGFPVHAFHLLVDRRMGLPPEMRRCAPQETGPMLESDRDWYEVAHTVPIEPHLNDFMIGSPASVTNVISALRNGVTRVGTVSQFHWRYPYCDDDVAQMASMVQAIAIIAAKRDEGAYIGSYQSDGYPGMYHDYASLVGWAKLERYLIEDLLGAKLTLDFGGLTYDPPKKAAVCLALERMNFQRHFTSFYHCNTIEYQRDVTQNYAVLSLDVIFLVMVVKLLRRRGYPGAGILPIPITEAIRIPTPEEILEAQLVMRRAADDADRIMDYVRWDKIDEMADKLVEGGERFFQNALSTLSAMGVDIGNPLAVFVALRRLGAVKTEELFGAGERDESFPRGLRPIVPTEMTRQSMDQCSESLKQCAVVGAKGKLAGKTAVVGSTDVHEFGVLLVKRVLEELGAKVVDGGMSADPEDLAKVALETDAAILAVSTHNGMALTYAVKLMEQLQLLGAAAVVLMGGILNEPVEGSPIPADVREPLRAMGIITCDDVQMMIDALTRPRCLHR